MWVENVYVCAQRTIVRAHKARALRGPAHATSPSGPGCLCIERRVCCNSALRKECGVNLH